MNLLDFLLSKKENKSQVEDPRIRQLEQQIEQLQYDTLQQKEVYKKLDTKLSNYEKYEDIVKLAELEEMRLRYHKLEEENIELSKRPSAEDFNNKNNQIQQLAMRLKNIEQVTVSKEMYEQLEQDTTHLKQALHTMTSKVEQLKNIVRDYKGKNRDLHRHVEQLEGKQATQIDAVAYAELEEKYNVIHDAHKSLLLQYEQQVQQNKLLHLEIQQLHAPETVKLHSTLKTDDLQVELFESELEESFVSVRSEEETPAKVEQDEVIVVMEEIPDVQLVLDDEEMERPAFDEVFLEEVSDDKEILVEQEVDEAQMVQSMADVLLKTVPTIDEGVTTPFPVYDASSFLPRNDESEHDYLRRVIDKLNVSMHEIRNIEFNNTYEIDFSTAYVEGIMRKRSYEHNRSLQYMKDRPYIGRVDYVTATGAETMYIGELGIDEYVISWKADAASLYYLRTVGQPIAHQTLGETIVDYTRQIDIQNGRIKTLHPPNTATNQYFKDEGLVSALTNKRGTDMQSIVATLQREQYEIIRLPMTQPIIIQGSAGSGKSAIALHRLSYLLYKYQNLKPDSVMILGPNEAFLRHVQNVLPTLGDFGIRQTTFLGIACDMLMISPSKVKRHKRAELEIIKNKGSLNFRNIVEQTTMGLFNDLRSWAKAYPIKSISIPIVPILREMEKYPWLTLKDRENLYFNFFLKSLNQELKSLNDIQQQLEEWVREKAKSIEKQEANLSLYENEFITTEIIQLGNCWVEDFTEYKTQNTDLTRKRANLSRQQFIASIQYAVQSRMEDHRADLQQSIPQTIDETIITLAWRHHMQSQLRKEREKIILEHISEQPVKVFSIDSFIETSIVQQHLEEVREHVLQQLETDKQGFFKTRKDMLHQALLTETLMLIERAYYKQIREALKMRYDLEYSFSNKYSGFTFEEKQQLSTAESDLLLKYVKDNLKKLDYFNCFDESIKVAKADGLLLNDYQIGDIYYEDLPALLHITRLIHGVSKEHMLSYLIVDEAQDYMPYEIVEMNALTKKNGLMLIGDLGQNLNPASSLQDWHALDALIGEPAYYELQATYRSTAQIVEVSNKIIHPFATGKYKLSKETFREGSNVNWVEITEESEEQKLIAALEEAVFTHHYESVAVVVKDESWLKHYHDLIDPYFSVAIQTETELPKNVKVVITTPTAAKGLEFDAVVIVHFNYYNFTDFDRKLAYVASSRALHHLYIMFEQGKKCLLSS